MAATRSKNFSHRPAIPTFPVHAIHDCLGGVPEVYGEGPFCPAGKGLVPNGAVPARECDGKLILLGQCRLERKHEK